MTLRFINHFLQMRHLILFPCFFEGDLTGSIASNKPVDAQTGCPKKARKTGLFRDGQPA
jgi:hypothetical protein